MRLYQLRLQRGDGMARLVRGLAEACLQAARRRPGFSGIRPQEIENLGRELRGVVLVFVSRTDVCGLQAICEENLSPASWNLRPEAGLCERRPWEADQVERFRLEVSDSLDEFSDALGAAAMRVLVRTPEQASQARRLRQEFAAAAVAVLGPYLYENPACGQCEICREGKVLCAGI